MSDQLDMEDCHPVFIEDTAVQEPNRWHGGSHQVEQAVQRVLLSDPNLNFSSLVVHRISDGVCLEGVLEVQDTSPNIDSLVRQISGIDTVLNHLVVRRESKPAAKG